MPSGLFQQIDNPDSLFTASLISKAREAAARGGSGSGTKALISDRALLGAFVYPQLTAPVLPLAVCWFVLDRVTADPPALYSYVRC